MSSHSSAEIGGHIRNFGVGTFQGGPWKKASPTAFSRAAAVALQEEDDDQQQQPAPVFRSASA
jgi:hypothetical protein